MKFDVKEVKITKKAKHLKWKIHLVHKIRNCLIYEVLG